MKKWCENAVFIPDLRAKAQVWCTEHGLDVHLVPVSGFLDEQEDGTIKVEVFVRDDVTGNIAYDFDAEAPLMRWAVVDGPMPDEELIEEVVMLQTEIAYCENGDCRVEMYQAITDSYDVKTEKNCPGCGQFGRMKNEPKEDTDAADSPA